MLGDVCGDQRKLLFSHFYFPQLNTDLDYMHSLVHAIMQFLFKE